MRVLLLVFFLGALAGCEDKPEPKILDEAEVARLIPAYVAKRAEWAKAVTDALRDIEKEATVERVCSVLAVIEQESNFQENPRVEGLPTIVRQGLEKKLKTLGPLAGPLLSAVLETRAPGSDKTFSERIDALKSERDLDRMFRDLETAYRKKMPSAFALAGVALKFLGKKPLHKLNPVTTLGSMQVKLAFAQARSENEGLDEAAVREILYTKAGGVRYGTVRLLDYPASYGDVVYRFADFNAGLYASRNAQFQSMLADLTGRKLILDGDLLSYDQNGESLDQETETLSALRVFADKAGLWNWVIDHDVAMEKTESFEQTLTWWRVRSIWEDRFQKEPPYARLPQLVLNSPKLSRERSTAWFATRVKDRYTACRKRQSS